MAGVTWSGVVSIGGGWHLLASVGVWCRLELAGADWSRRKSMRVYARRFTLILVDSSRSVSFRAELSQCESC